MTLNQIWSAIKTILIACGAFFIRKGGKDAVKAEVAEETVEATHDAKKIHDAIDSDPDFNDSVSNRFDR